MTRSESLAGLLERVKKATGTDDELALELGQALHLDLDGAVLILRAVGGGSIDAALALVERMLPGAEWSWQVSGGPGKLGECIITRRGRFLVAGDAEFYGRGATTPIAILSALLTALTEATPSLDKEEG